MLQGNSDLKVKEGEVSSRPWQWPINYRVTTSMYDNHVRSKHFEAQRVFIKSWFLGTIFLGKQPEDIFVRQSHHLVGQHSLSRDIHSSLYACMRARTAWL